MSIWLIIYYLLAPPICMAGLIFVKAVQPNDGMTLTTYALLIAGVVIINANLLWMIHYAGGSASGQQSRVSSVIETALAGVGAGFGTAFIVWISAPLGSYVIKDWILMAILLSAANLIGAYTIANSSGTRNTGGMLGSRADEPEPLIPSRSGRPVRTDAAEGNLSPGRRLFNNNDWFSPVADSRSSGAEITSLLDAADLELAANRLHQASSLYNESIEASRHLQHLPASIWRAEFGIIICLARLNQHAEAVSGAVDLLQSAAPVTDDVFLTLLEYSRTLANRQCWGEVSKLLTVVSDVSGNRIDPARKLVVMIRLSLALIHTSQVTPAIAMLNKASSFTAETVALNMRDSTYDELTELVTQLTSIGESSARQNAHALSSVLYATAVRILNLLRASS